MIDKLNTEANDMTEYYTNANNNLDSGGGYQCSVMLNLIKPMSPLSVEKLI